MILWVGFGWPVAVFLMALGEKKGQGVWALIGVMFLSAIFYSTVARVVADIANVQEPNYRGAGSACHCLLVARQSVEHL